MSPRARRSSSHDDVVTFDRPPVGEVALTTQFTRDVVNLEVLAAFSSVVKAELPNQQQHPKLPPMREPFDVPPQQPSLEISFDPPNALPRTWFISGDGARLIQLQGDRISLNWIRQPDEADYPRYKNLQKHFRGYFDTLKRCVDAAGQAPPEISVCEVTYVNPIEAPKPPKGGGHPELAQILNRIRPRPGGSFLPHAEDAQIQARWRIPGAEIDVGDRPAGRLHLSAAPGFKPPTSLPIYIVTVTGRVLPADSGESAAWKALKVAHDWAVLGFKDLTTSSMHKHWGLRAEEGG